jgi:hypothetical protein
MAAGISALSTNITFTTSMSLIYNVQDLEDNSLLGYLFIYSLLTKLSQ